MLAAGSMMPAVRSHEKVIRIVRCSRERSMPGWRNGRRDGLKHHCPKGRVGSTPIPGTETVAGESWLDQKAWAGSRRNASRCRPAGTETVASESWLDQKAWARCRRNWHRCRLAGWRVVGLAPGQPQDAELAQYYGRAKSSNEARTRKHRPHADIGQRIGLTPAYRPPGRFLCQHGRQRRRRRSQRASPGGHAPHPSANLIPPWQVRPGKSRFTTGPW